MRTSRQIKVGTIALIAMVVSGIVLGIRLTGQSHEPVKVTAATVESTRPLTLTEARQHMTFPFPESARNIQIAEYHEWMAAFVFIRFEAPLEDCLAAAGTVVNEYNKANPDRPIAGPVGIKTVEHVIDDPRPLSVPWFNPRTIRHGFGAGGWGSHLPMMWIDSDEGVFYYQYFGLIPSPVISRRRVQKRSRNGDESI